MRTHNSVSLRCTSANFCIECAATLRGGGAHGCGAGFRSLSANTTKVQLGNYENAQLTNSDACISKSSPSRAQQMQEAVAFMAAVRGAFPEVARTVRTSQVAHSLLAHKAHLVEQVALSGECSVFHSNKSIITVSFDKV